MHSGGTGFQNRDCRPITVVNDEKGQYQSGMARFEQLAQEITDCQLCADRFQQTHTAHLPRPVFWVSQTAPILICGQAPGMRVYQSGIPFDDPSGDRLRDWMGLDRDQFYDRSQISILPMAFCFPGYDHKGSDLPPPKICANSWHNALIQTLPSAKVTLLVGGYAQKWHLQVKTGVTDTVRDWRTYGPKVFPLPHPSWRNTAWIKKNPWFQEELLPELKSTIKNAFDD